MGHHKQMKQLSSTCRNIDNIEATNAFGKKKKCNPLSLHRTLNSFHVSIISLLICSFAKIFSERARKMSLRVNSLTAVYLCNFFFFTFLPLSVQYETCFFSFSLSFTFSACTLAFSIAVAIFLRSLFSVFISLRFVHKRREEKKRQFFFGEFLCDFWRFFFCQKFHDLSN